MDEKGQIRATDVSEDTLWYVACCAHVDESAEVTQAGQLREDWMRMMLTRGGMHASRSRWRRTRRLYPSDARRTHGLVRGR